MLGEVDLREIDAEFARHAARGPATGDVAIENLELPGIDVLLHAGERGGQEVRAPFVFPEGFQIETGGVGVAFDGGGARWSSSPGAAGRFQAVLPGAAAELVGDAPAGGLQQPALERADRRIVAQPGDVARHGDDGFLHGVLRFGVVQPGGAGHAVEQAAVTLEKRAPTCLVVQVVEPFDEAAAGGMQRVQGSPSLKDGRMKADAEGVGGPVGSGERSFNAKARKTRRVEEERKGEDRKGFDARSLMRPGTLGARVFFQEMLPANCRSTRNVLLTMLMPAVLFAIRPVVAVGVWLLLSATAQAQGDTFLRDYAQTRGFMLGRPVNATPTPDGKSGAFPAGGVGAGTQPGALRVRRGQRADPAAALAADALKGASDKLSPEEKARRERQRISVGGFTAFSISKDSALVLLQLAGKLYVLTRASGDVAELATGAGTILDPKFSPDSKRVAYVRNQDVCVFDLATGKEHAVTTGGTETVSHGLAEFVAQEEMDAVFGLLVVAGFAEHRLSGKRRVESRKLVRQRPGATGGEPPRSFYPRPGKENVAVRLGVVSVARGEDNAPTLARMGPREISVPRQGDVERAWPADADRAVARPDRSRAAGLRPEHGQNHRAADRARRRLGQPGPERAPVVAGK